MGLERRSVYQVRLWALNVNGSGPPTEWYTVETYENDLDESQVPDMPTGLKGKEKQQCLQESTGSWKKVLCKHFVYLEALGDANEWGTVLQARRSWVQFPLVSLEYFIYMILSTALWPWDWLSFQQKWVPGIFPGGKDGWCIGLTNLLPSCADCLEIWEPQSPGTLWTCNLPVQRLLYLYLCMFTCHFYGTIMKSTGWGTAYKKFRCFVCKFSGPWTQFT